MNVPFLDLKTQYHVFQHEIEEKALEVLESCSYIGGKYVKDFEDQLAAYLGENMLAIGCNSGTDALMLALRACNIQPGDEVITTSFSFFATAEAISAIGAVPVFADIRENDFTINPEQIVSRITNKTKAILPVHIFGTSCQMDEIMDIAHTHNLKVIEDAAQAIGSTYKGRKVGTLGDVACFSFYPTKNLGGCGDGGAVTTSEKNLATIVYALREHGAGKTGAKARELLNGISEDQTISEYSSDLYDPYKYYNYLIGYNSRLDAIQAAILSVKLKYLDSFNLARKRIAAIYNERLTDKVIKPAYEDSTSNSCWHQYVIRCNNKRALCDRLMSLNIGYGTFYPVPLHKQKVYGYNESLPVAEAAAAQTVCLPIFPELKETEVDYIIDSINKFMDE